MWSSIMPQNQYVCWFQGVNRTAAVVAAVLFFVGSAAGQPVDPLEATGKEVIGYAKQVSVTAGQNVQIMVSASQDQYQAQLVRLIHGDQDPKGPGYKEKEIKAPLNGIHKGRAQTWDAGSYVKVPDHKLLDVSGSFTLQAWVYPTTPKKGVQGLITKWSGNNRGYGLFIEENGSLGFWIGSKAEGVRKVSTGKAFHTPKQLNGGFHEANWYFVAVSYDAKTGTVDLYQEPVTRWPLKKTGRVVTKSVTPGAPGVNSSPLIMAGYQKTFEDNRPMVAGNLNGKIDRPRLFNRALTPEQIEGLKQGGEPEESGYGLVSGWDFSRQMRSTKVVDASASGLDGVTINMPMRGMTGYNWTGDVVNYNYAPKQYGAIYFHDDDLEDARWAPSLRYAVPKNLESGIYAVRLRTDTDEDYVPFVVAPAANAKKADIAFLVPTFTYMAYANIGNACPACSEMPANGLYSRHTDGSGVAYTTWRQPILDMRPKAVTRWGAGGSTPRHLSGDLYMIDWLEKKGFTYDVITDHDLHRQGKAILNDYNVVVTGSHPEYVSEKMWNSLQSYLKEGGRLMYMGGNGFYWVTEVPQEKPFMIEVRRWGGTQGWEIAPGQRYQISDGKLGGLWRNRGRPPQKLVGVGFTAQGFDKNGVYARKPGSKNPRAQFIFEGLASVDSIGAFPSIGMGYGEAGDEVDRLDYRLGTPPHTLLLGRADSFSSAYQLVVEDVLEMGSGFGSEHPLVRSDIVYFEYPNQGAVFSTSSISWIEGLSAQNYKNPVSRMTENVLRMFAAEGPLPGPKEHP